MLAGVALGLRTDRFSGRLGSGSATAGWVWATAPVTAVSNSNVKMEVRGFMMVVNGQVYGASGLSRGHVDQAALCNGLSPRVPRKYQAA